jgi:hypothetical protein
VEGAELHVLDVVGSPTTSGSGFLAQTRVAALIEGLFLVGR